jgi:hypothetical protein
MTSATIVVEQTGGSTLDGALVTESDPRVELEGPTFSFCDLFRRASNNRSLRHNEVVYLAQPDSLLDTEPTGNFRPVEELYPVPAGVVAHLKCVDRVPCTERGRDFRAHVGEGRYERRCDHARDTLSRLTLRSEVRGPAGDDVPVRGA